jgi:hypothetical protein
LSTKGTLYLFLHGLSVGHEPGNRVEIILPAVPGHMYKAGSWLTETDIAPNSTLTLDGVTHGKKKLSHSKHIVKLSGCGLTKRARAATLSLPRPKQILELLKLEVTVKFTNPTFGATFTGGAPPAALASILVLIYDYNDENQLFLDNHDWEPCSTGGATSLHIISTSVGPEGKDHEVDTENVLHHVIENYPGLTFDDPALRPAPNWNETGDAEYGDLPGLMPFAEYIVTTARAFAFAQAELEMIPTRTIRIGRLGRMKQQGRPIGALWQEPDPLYTNPCNCGHRYIGR